MIMHYVYIGDTPEGGYPEPGDWSVMTTGEAIRTVGQALRAEKAGDQLAVFVRTYDHATIEVEGGSA